MSYESTEHNNSGNSTTALLHGSGLQGHWPWGVPFLLATVLFVVSYFNFLLFHTLAELFAVAVAVTFSVVAWQTFPFSKNNYLMFLGCGYFWVAMLDLLHSLAYQGMGVFAFSDPNAGIELWLVARYLEAVILMISPFYLTKKIDRKALFSIMGVVFALLVIVVFSGVLPVAFIEGQGLTDFKVISEYVIIALLLSAMAILWVRRDLLETRILRLIIFAMLLTVCAELAFTFYISIFDLSNVLGHIFKFFSYWLIFVAVIRTTLESPFLAMSRGANTYDAIPDVTMVVDGDGMIRQINRAATEMVGINKEKLMGKHCHSIYHPNELSVDLCPVCQKIAEGEAVSSIELEDVKNGKYFDYSLSEIRDTLGVKGMVQTVRDITLRKKAEHRLYQSERYNRMLFDSSPIGLALCRMDGQVVDANPAYAEIIGYSLAETMNCSYWQLTPDKYIQQEREQLASLQVRGSYGPYEKEYRHKDGHLVPVRLRGMLLEKEGEQYIWSSVENISAQKEAARELSEFRSALDASKDNVFLIDPATMRFVNFNKTASEALSYERSELLAMGPQDIEPEFPVQRLLSIFSALLRGDQEFADINTVHVRKDGSKFPVEVRLSTVQLEGRATMIAVARDVSERKRAEEKLNQSAVVVKNTAEGIIITDKASRITSVNPAFTEITGYSEDEVIGKSPRFLKSNKHSHHFYRHIWRQVEETGRWQGEVWNRKKDNTLFPAWSTISSVLNEEQQVTHYVGVIADISSLKQSQKKIDFLAYHDPLTKLPNRLLLSDRLDHALHVADRNGTKVGVLFLDLDRFKNINDSLGHSVGDQLLAQVASRLQATVRDEDTVARLGGDEFVVLIESINRASDVVNLANKLLSSFRESFELSGHTLFVSSSIGASVYPEDGDDYETLIRNADTAMYRAKEVGRNNYYLYSAELTEQALERLTLEGALRHALQSDELELFFQPQFLLESDKLQGVEALVRWNHPQLGQILPDQFIPLAEESGMIVEIGAWALNKACSKIMAWKQQGLALETVAVNVSGIQFQSGNIVSTVELALSSSGLPAHCLELEVTESIILKRPEEAIEALYKLKKLGVMISIDDFGTGYSSLSQLKQLPVDKLKIDQSFVRDILDDIDDEVITCAVIALGQSMGLKVIAEGVETEAQRDFLISHGCDEGQGYLYSQPVPASVLERKIFAGEFSRNYAVHETEQADTLSY